MKNLKISKKAKALLLAGSTFVLIGVTSNQIGKDDDSYYDGLYNKAKLSFELIKSDEVPLTRVDDYLNYLSKNDLVLYSDAKKEIEKNYNLDGLYYQKKSDSHDWKMLSKEELLNFTGILKSGENIEYKTYTVEDNSADINKKRVYGIEENENYFVDMNDPLEIKNGEEYYCHEGNITNKVYKK